MAAEDFRDTGSDYDRIGGGPAVKAVVDRFYDPISRLLRVFKS